jgi:hypothetical protein
MYGAVRQVKQEVEMTRKTDYFENEGVIEEKVARQGYLFTVILLLIALIGSISIFDSYIGKSIRDSKISSLQNRSYEIDPLGRNHYLRT